MAGALSCDGVALTAGVVIIAALFLLSLPVVISLGSALVAYIWSASTLTFRRIQGEG